MIQVNWLVIFVFYTKIIQHKSCRRSIACEKRRETWNRGHCELGRWVKENKCRLPSKVKSFNLLSLLQMRSSRIPRSLYTRSEVCRSKSFLRRTKLKISYCLFLADICKFFPVLRSKFISLDCSLQSMDSR